LLAGPLAITNATIRQNITFRKETTMFKPQRRRTLVALGSAALAFACGTAVANDSPDNYPTKAIRLVVPLPPGSPPDVLARVVSERLQAAWGQPVVVENRPGATGMIGLDAVARSAP